jgi:hypothetical protein
MERSLAASFAPPRGISRTPTKELLMSTEESESDLAQRTRNRYLLYGIGAAAVAVIGIGIVYSLRSPPPPVEKKDDSRQANTLESVKIGLAKTTDYGTCKNAIQQLNLYLSQYPERKASPLTDEQRKCLTEKCLGDPTEIAEIEGGAFTLLDAQHLDECFLFRDAAQSLEVNGLSATEQAAAAFRWVVRQVRLRASLHLDPMADPDPIPPQFVLRRGWGTPEERALVFLALLRQLSIEGCLIGSPGPDAAHPIYWACGALVDVKPEKDNAGDKQVLLFDHRMGMLLPGAKDKEILTLSALCAHPEILKTYTVNPEYAYDVNPEMVAGAEIHLVTPLSGLAPRMVLLQSDLLAPAIKGRLALNVEESLNQFAKAAPRMGDKNIPTQVAPRFTGVLRRFLPPDEGGADKRFPGGFDPRALPGLVREPELPVEMMHKRLFEFELVPWNFLPALVGHLPLMAELGRRPRGMFSQMFVSFYLEPGKPRDQVLRGKYEEAVDYLVNFRDQLKDFKKRLKGATNDAQFMEQLAAWPKKAQDAFGAQAHAEKGDPGITIAEAKQQVADVWKEGDFLFAVLLQGLAADPLNVETTNLLALAKHEQAVRLQARVDRDREDGKEVSAADVDAARKAWQTALSWWNDLAAETYAAAVAPAARWHQAEARFALGDKDAARAFLSDLSGDLSPLEKTARLYRVSKLKHTSP